MSTKTLTDAMKSWRTVVELSSRENANAPVTSRCALTKSSTLEVHVG